MVTLKNSDLTVKINELGAELRSIVCADTEYMWEGKPEIWSGTAPIMFPICGGLKEDKYYDLAQAGDTIALHDRPDFSTMGATVAAGRKAFAQAKIEHKDVDFVEVHDCFTIAELCAIEDLGFVPKGTAGKFTAEGETQITDATFNATILFPVILAGCGLVGCLIGLGLANIKKMGDNPSKELDLSTWISAGCTIVFGGVASYFIVWCVQRNGKCKLKLLFHKFVNT